MNSIEAKGQSGQWLKRDHQNDGRDMNFKISAFNAYHLYLLLEEFNDM